MTSRLLADIGGTNARFAWQAGPGAPVTDATTLACSDYASLELALRAYLRRLGRATPRDCAIAIANPVLGDHIQMTNHEWSFSISELQTNFCFDKLRVLNDFKALALALPMLSTDERVPLSGGSALPDAPIGVIGPGTGLGVSGLLPDGQGGWIALEGEGGHVTLAGRTPRERQVLEILDARYGHASAERAVSGRGLVALHAALEQLDGGNTPSSDIDAAGIVGAALTRHSDRCFEALNLFCAFLGNVAGNLALTLGARGGIYVAGGIVPRLGAFIGGSPFRERFEDKGRFSAYLAQIPVFVVCARQSPALLGAARALDMTR